MKGINTAKLVLLAFAALAAEVTVLDDLAWFGARVELLFVIACFAALFARDRRQALITCWIVGLVKDVGSASAFGLHALLFLLAGWVITSLKQIVFRESIATQVAVAAAGCAAVGVASALAVSIGAGSIPASLWLTKTLFSALVTALVAPILMQTLAQTKFMVR
jgi:rod shape-determining protein MreD